MWRIEVYGDAGKLVDRIITDKWTKIPKIIRRVFFDYPYLRFENTKINITEVDWNVMF